MQMNRITGFLVLLIAATLAFTGCANPKGDNVADKRADVQRMKAETLATFHAKMPQLRGDLEKAPGYGVFSGVSTQSMIVATGNGFGIIHDNSTGKETYMKALKLGGGLGAGVQSVNAVVVFHDSKTMYDVLRDGWGVTGKVDAAAKIGESGDAGAVVITLPGMSIYRFTNNGVMLGGAIEGTKVWPDKELNAM